MWSLFEDYIEPPFSWKETLIFWAVVLIVASVIAVVVTKVSLPREEEQVIDYSQLPNAANNYK